MVVGKIGRVFRRLNRVTGPSRRWGRGARGSVITRIARLRTGKGWLQRRRRGRRPHCIRVNGYGYPIGMSFYKNNEKDINTTNKMTHSDVAYRSLARMTNRM